MSAADLTAALAAMADTLGTVEIGCDVGQHMTCTEADVFALVMVAADWTEEAAAFLLGHAAGDDDPDDWHRGWIEDRGDGLGTRYEMDRARQYVTEQLIGS